MEQEAPRVLAGDALSSGASVSNVDTEEENVNKNTLFSDSDHSYGTIVAPLSETPLVSSVLTRIRRAPPKIITDPVSETEVVSSARSISPMDENSENPGALDHGLKISSGNTLMVARDFDSRRSGSVPSNVGSDRDSSPAPTIARRRSSRLHPAEKHQASKNDDPDDDEDQSGTDGPGSSSGSPSKRPVGREKLEYGMKYPPIERQLNPNLNVLWDGFCWRCHKALPLKEQHGCPSCVRVYHHSCWWNFTPYSSKDSLDTHPIHMSLEHSGEEDCLSSGSASAECVECYCIDEESKRTDNIYARVGTEKFKTYLLYMMRFVDEHLPEERVRPFAIPVLQQAECSEAVKQKYAELITYPMDLRQIKKNINDGKYTTCTSFLADLRWIYHNTSIFNGQNNRYTRSAFYIVETCQHLRYSLDWCMECFERGMPLPGETIPQAVERGMIQPCSDPHAVVWVKAEKYPIWPAIVYRFNGIVADVRFFGAFEFGVFPKDAVFLFSKSVSSDRRKGKVKADYDNALRQFRQHVAKLRLIPDKQLVSYPKRTPYDGRLRMFPEGDSIPEATPSHPVPQINLSPETDEMRSESRSSHEATDNSVVHSKPPVESTVTVKRESPEAERALMRDVGLSPRVASPGSVTIPNPPKVAMKRPGVPPMAILQKRIRLIEPQPVAVPETVQPVETNVQPVETNVQPVAMIEESVLIMEPVIAPETSAPVEDFAAPAVVFDEMDQDEAQSPRPLQIVETTSETPDLSHSEAQTSSVPQRTHSPTNGTESLDLAGSSSSDPHSTKNRRKMPVPARCVRPNGRPSSAPAPTIAEDSQQMSTESGPPVSIMDLPDLAKSDFNEGSSVMETDPPAAGSLAFDDNRRPELPAVRPEGIEVAQPVKPVTVQAESEADADGGEMPSFEMPEDAQDVRTRTAGKLDFMLKRNGDQKRLSESPKEFVPAEVSRAGSPGSAGSPAQPRLVTGALAHELNKTVVHGSPAASRSVLHEALVRPGYGISQDAIRRAVNRKQGAPSMASSQSHLIEALRASPRPLNSPSSVDSSGNADENRPSGDTDGVQVIQADSVAGAEENPVYRPRTSNFRNETLGSLLAAGTQSRSSDTTQKGPAAGGILSRIVQETVRDTSNPGFSGSGGNPRMTLPRNDGSVFGQNVRGQTANYPGQMQFRASQPHQAQRMVRPETSSQNTYGDSVNLQRSILQRSLNSSTMIPGRPANGLLNGSPSASRTPPTSQEVNGERLSPSAMQIPLRNLTGSPRNIQAVGTNAQDRTGNVANRSGQAPDSVQSQIELFLRNTKKLVREKKTDGAHAVRDINQIHTDGLRLLQDVQAKSQAASEKIIVDLQDALDQSVRKFELLFMVFQNETDFAQKTKLLELSRVKDLERQRAITAAKRQLWCCVCQKRAKLVCCGVTVYCSDSCQINNAALHRVHCRRTATDEQEATVYTPYGTLNRCQNLPGSLGEEEDLDDDVMEELDSGNFQGFATDNGWENAETPAASTAQEEDSQE